MSNELKALSNMRADIIDFRHLIEEFSKDYEIVFHSGDKDYEIILQALKRNEPMKPLLKDMGFEHYDIYCSSCKEYIGYRNSVRESLTLKYCPDCGQKLDWRKENE